jgi:hypothetical protein
MALRSTAFLDSTTYGFEWLRLLAELALQEGVLGTTAGTDFKVTAAAAGGMRVDIASGIALVKGDSGAPGTGLTQGLYPQVNDASVANAVTLTAAHATLPRIDQIVLQINDSTDLGSAGNVPAFAVVTGVATAGATLDNRTGAAALPNNALPLADALVAAASVAVVAGNIRDRRRFARGFRYMASLSDFVWGSGVLTLVTGSQVRAELGAGNVIAANYRCSRNNTNAIADRSQSSFHYDGAQQPSIAASSHYQDIPVSLWGAVNNHVELPGVTGASHLLEWRLARVAGANYTDSGPQVFYEEIIRPNVNNN